MEDEKEEDERKDRAAWRRMRKWRDGKWMNSPRNRGQTEEEE